MSKPRSSVLAATLLISQALVSQALRGDTSLCLRTHTDCVLSEGVEVRVVVGASDQAVAGGQFVLRYDPALLQFIEAMPGRTCDPDSPFSLEILGMHDVGRGEVFYAAGIDFQEATEGSSEEAMLACLIFAPTGSGDAATDTCLVKGADPGATKLVDDGGRRVFIDNSADCPTGFAPPSLTCDAVEPAGPCPCVGDDAACEALDTACGVGVCNDLTELCEVAPVNEGGVCDDGDPCTLVDRCTGGVCVGSVCQRRSVCPASSPCKRDRDDRLTKGP